MLYVLDSGYIDHDGHWLRKNKKISFLVSNYKYLNNKQKIRQGKKNGLEIR